jgi:hypothetical protein
MGKVQPRFRQYQFVEGVVDGLTLVPALNTAPRAPFGPSLVLTNGMPFAGMATVLQWSAALSRDTFHASVWWTVRTSKASHHDPATHLFNE